jgi:hypothetical protein
MEKELEVKERELQDTFDARSRLKNMRDNRIDETSLSDQVMEIKSLIENKQSTNYE